jgi:sugar/nucleoside kinase (ribokinase family)
MNIFIFGTVCIDKNTSENSSYINSGGPAIHMNNIFKQFGDCTVTTVASYGPDLLPYIKDLNLYPSSPSCDKTLIYENIMKNGIRVQKSTNRNYAFSIDIDVTLSELLQKTDIVFFAPQQPIFSKTYIESITKRIKKDTITVLLPQGYFRDFDQNDQVIVREFIEASDILPYINIVITSEQDHPKMMGMAKEWSKKNNIISIVTLGEKGAISFKKNQDFNLPTNPIPLSQIIDSVGAGDIFSASFAYKYRRSNDILISGNYANAVTRQCLFFPSDKRKIDLHLL